MVDYTHANSSIIIESDRDGLANNYTNYYQFGGTLSELKGHRFWTGGELSSQVERVRISNNGVYISNNVGIGTASPSSLLHILSSSLGNDSVINVSHDGTGESWFGRITSRNSTSDVSSFLGNYNGKAGVFSHNNALSSWGPLYVNTLGVNGQGSVYLPPNTYIQNLSSNDRNLVLHLGNYNTYAAKVDGTGATGTWGISISGNSATTNKLKDSVTIAGQTFDGSSSINIPFSSISSKPTIITGISTLSESVTGLIKVNNGTVSIVPTSDSSFNFDNIQTKSVNIASINPSTDIGLQLKSNAKFVSPDGNSYVTSRMTDYGSLTFSSTAGQLFSITNSLSGTLFAINDISGMPSIEVLDTGNIKLAQYSGYVGIGSSSPIAPLDITATLGTYSSTGNTLLRLTNPSSTGQSPLDFFINGTLKGRFRSDYSGNMNYVVNGGSHLFYIGGDVGIGSQVGYFDANGAYFPKYYDSNNSAYYLDPASTSNLNGLTVTGTITGSISGNANSVTNGVYTTDTGSVTNQMLAGSIANSKLTNSSFYIGNTNISLGRTSGQLSLTGVSIDGNANNETLATVTGRGASTSTAVTFSSGANHYQGHLYYDPYDTAGNHYPHFSDGSGGSGSKVNWRLFTGATNSHTHIWNTTSAYFATRVESASDFRGTQFTDSDNTAYYVNPASTSNLNSVQITSLSVFSTTPSTDTAVQIKSKVNYLSSDGNYSIKSMMYPTNNGTLSFEGTSGQLFSITNSMSGTIYSVNDISGIPSIEVLDTGLIKLAQYSGNIVIGSGTDNGVDKLQVTGSITASTIKNTGTYTSTINIVSVLNIDCSLGNYFIKTINGSSTFTVSNVPSSVCYAFTLELTHISGTVTWFNGVRWNGGTTPSLTAGKTHLFTFITDDGGETWRASALVDYTI